MPSLTKLSASGKKGSSWRSGNVIADVESCVVSMNVTSDPNSFE